MAFLVLIGSQSLPKSHELLFPGPLHKLVVSCKPITVYNSVPAQKLCPSSAGLRGVCLRSERREKDL
jgi:hypothetical protein